MARLTGVKVLDMVGGDVTRISYEGEEYTRVDEARAGDVVKVVVAWGSIAKGDFYKVTKISGGTGKRFIYIDERNWANGYEHYFEIFRKVSEPSHEERISDLETRVDKLEEVENSTKLKTVDRDAKVGERILITNKIIGEDNYDDGDILTVYMSGFYGDVRLENGTYILRKEYEVVVEEEKATEPRDKFKNGDKVRLISGGDRYPLRGFEDGKVYEVEDVETTYHSGRRIEITDRGVLVGYALPSQLEKVEETTLKLTVGDYAKVVGITHCNDIKRSTYVKIVSERDSDGDYRIELIDESDFDYAKPESLEKVELTDEDLTFLKIGRKPGEVKDGDIVRITANTNYSVNKVGDIGIIKGGGGLNPIVLVSGRSGGQHLSHTKRDEMELIAPVESRVDLDE